MDTAIYEPIPLPSSSLQSLLVATADAGVAGCNLDLNDVVLLKLIGRTDLYWTAAGPRVLSMGRLASASGDSSTNAVECLQLCETIADCSFHMICHGGAKETHPVVGALGIFNPPLVCSALRCCSDSGVQ